MLMLRGLVSILSMTVLARSSDPAGLGEWVCENPRTGEIERQIRNPVFDNN